MEFDELASEPYQRRQDQPANENSRQGPHSERARGMDCCIQKEMMKF